MLRNILLGAGLLAALFTILIFSGKLPIGKNSSAPKGEVVIWGTISNDFMNPLIQQYNIKAETYRVSYREINEVRFVSTLVDALANGAGPDMILAPYQIILSQSSRLYPYPITSITEKVYKDAYVDGASIFWSPYGALALPVSIEPMVLFYNRTLLSKHGVANPPTYWEELINIAPKLTVTNNNNFVESAISLGAYNNVPYTKDILVAIVNQLGQVPVIQQYSQNGLSYDIFINTPVASDPSQSLPLVTATRFITQFSDPAKSTYTWSQYQPQAQELFVAEKLAMYIGYSGEFASLQSSNQKLDLGMTFIPQTNNNTFTTGMRMYGLATLRQSKNPKASLFTEGAFASANWSPIIASAVGGVSPIKGIISQSGLSEVISRSALVARGWPDIYYNSTSDLFSKMLDEILTGRSLVTEAVDRFESRFINLYNGVK